MLILYITYVSFDQAFSGSSVRPQKMYRAMTQEGHTVKLLSGSQNRDRRRERWEAVAEVSRWMEDHRPDVCYIESPVYPILWGFDRRLIRRVHRMGVPIGYFYRDFYWKFPDLYPRRRDLIGSLKERYLDMLQVKTDRLLEQCADIVYFPSMAAAAMFSFGDMRALPPAGEPGLLQSVGEKNTCIYVGGLSGAYGGETLLRAFSILNSGEERYPLLLVCREKEWRAVSPELKRGDWLEVHHTSGSGLLPLYERASLAVLPVQRTAYTDVAVNIKFFEYMSYGLPVASTDVTAIADLVKKNGVGSVSQGDPESMAANIRAMLADEEQMERWRVNAADTLRSRNLWVHRVRQLTGELSGKNARKR